MYWIKVCETKSLKSIEDMTTSLQPISWLAGLNDVTLSVIVLF